MEVYMCGFNTHQQLFDQDRHHNDDVAGFEMVYRSPGIDVRCALWSSTVIDIDGILVHRGFRPSGSGPVVIEGPRPRNIKTIFGDTSGVLGALSRNGSVYLFMDNLYGSKDPGFQKHHFSEDSFIVRQNLSIEHLAIADNGEVCICTNMASHQRTSSGFSSPLSAGIPRVQSSLSTAKLEIHRFASFEEFLSSEPPTSTCSLFSPLVSLLASATCFTALTVTQEVLTFGSALHPQIHGRSPTPSSLAEKPCLVPFLGGIPIRKIAVGGWIGAAVSEDNDLYIWGGQAGEAKKVNALPRPSDGAEVALVDINGGADVVDVGVGSGHILALTGDGKVWATGEGEYGQLGTGTKAFEEDWVRVRGEWEGKGRVVEVDCGVWCSWVLVDTRQIG
ncbi:hypothetical protein ABVK25_009742 [Lepraria finkii]|uniref:Uncharacterized protein n=1 Tax=Lepraria finkii TaxID=1340010 RepID=A0ABR4AWH5_9LECA